MTSRPFIVSISPIVPHPGIAHAGGGYYLDHLRALTRFAEVTVVAPLTAES
jgi:hypothetical protein